MGAKMRLHAWFWHAPLAGLALSLAGFAAHAEDCAARPWRCPAPQPPVAAGQPAAGATPEALAAAIGKDPSFLPGTLSFTSYHRGAVAPISEYDANAGVIAEFVVDFDYLVPDPTTGLTYRVFRDAVSARSYFDRMFNGAPGKVVVRASSGTADPKKDGYSSINCESFLDTRVLHQVTTRCAAAAAFEPVVVSAVRIQQGRATPGADGEATRTVDDLREAEAMDIGLVWIGIQRVRAEDALLDAGAAGGAQTYSGYGTPPAPPSPPPPPDQVAAAQRALTACQRAAAVPNAQAVGPCMYDHGWTDRMTLDCSYGNKPNDPACYIPRRRPGG